MSLTLGTELRATVWSELDWSTAAPVLADSVLNATNLSNEQQAVLLRQLGGLCEFSVLDPQFAADLYGASYSADNSQPELLARIRHLYLDMGLSEKAAQVAELEFLHHGEARYQAIAGQAWLDAGQPGRALAPLLDADSASPGNPHLAAALEIAQRQWVDPQVRANELLSAARRGQGNIPVQALQVARILRMLDLRDERYEEALQLCLHVQPNLPSACHLMELHLLHAGRLRELADHFRVRARAAPTRVMAARLLFQGSGLLLNANDGDDAGPLFAEALEQSQRATRTSIPNLLAQLRAIFATTGRERTQVVEFAESVYQRIDSIDEQVGLAIFCAQISWLAQKDRVTAERWAQRLQSHCHHQRLIVEFKLE